MAADIILPSTPIHSPQSPMGQELARWEVRRENATNLVPIAHGRPAGAGPYPFVHQEYPKMLYRAGRPDSGNVKIVDSLTVYSEREEQTAIDDGFRQGQDKALEAFKARDVEFAKLAAERHFHERRMSEQAQAEAHAIDSETVQHVPEIPATPIKKRGRPAKKLEVS